MGQKTHPLGFRVGVIKGWESNWYEKNSYAPKLKEDSKIREYVRNRLKKAGIYKLIIDRTSKKILLTIHTSRPGVVIGKSGKEITQLEQELKSITDKDVKVTRATEDGCALAGVEVCGALETPRGVHAARRVHYDAAANIDARSAHAGGITEGDVIGTCRTGEGYDEDKPQPRCGTESRRGDEVSESKRKIAAHSSQTLPISQFMNPVGWLNSF